MNLNLEKKFIRQKYLQTRNEISYEYLKNASQKISQTLFSLNDYKICKNIFAFLSIKNEILTNEIIKTSLKLNKNVFVPILTNVKGEIFFSEIYKDTIFLKNCFGILEPQYHKNILKKSNKETIILVPAIVYSKQKFRIGYGGGYYDRFLQKNKSLANIGICLNELIIEDFKKDSFDKKVNYIITEKNIVY